MDNKKARVVGRLFTAPDGSIAQSQRSATRYPCKPDQVLTILVRPSLAKYQVTPHDICANGLSFFIDQPLDVGSVLAIQRVVIGPSGSWVRSGRVEHCTPVEGGYVVGVELTPFFSAEELEELIDKRNG
jgi:hypothetical protein